MLAQSSIFFWLDLRSGFDEFSAPAAVAQVLVPGAEWVGQMQLAAQICRGTSVLCGPALLLHHHLQSHMRPVECGGLWFMPTDLVGLYFSIFHSSPSLMAQICAVSLPAVSCVCLLNTSLVLFLKTPKCLLQLLLSLKDNKPPVLTNTEML